MSYTNLVFRRGKLSEQINRRKYIRFAPDPAEFAQIDKQAESESFNFQFVGLIVDEAPLSGCCLAIQKGIGLKPDDKVRIKLGELHPLKAKVIWVKQIDNNLVKCGFQFLE